MLASALQTSLAAAPAHTRGTPLTPTSVADTLLTAAVRTGAELILFEPHPTDKSHYRVSLERRQEPVAQAVLTSALGSAAIARFAFLSDVDLLVRTPTTGQTQALVAGHLVDVIVTVRPGAVLRAEVYVRIQDARAPDRPAAKLGVGARVGNYRVVEALGAGGMGSVFRVEHMVLGRSFALKVLHAHMFASDPGASDGFLREARAAARVKHPNIVDVVDFGHLADGRPYLIMEFLDGSSVSEWEAADHEPAEALRIGRQIAHGLAAAHAAGVVHADVSSGNIFVSPAGHAWLVDFGLAQFLDDPRRRSSEVPEFVVGTPSYIAPELIQGKRPDPFSDQYALGAVLFELLTGTPPYTAKSVRELCIMHLSAPIPSCSAQNPAVPAAVDAILRRCLAKSPESRFPKTGDLVDALDQVLASSKTNDWRRWLES
ncbi:MAG: serine/threonine-protein kinase [Kofleriaceae bacterium]